MTISPAPTRTRVHNPARRLGYSIAIAVNAAMIYVVSNLQEWETLPFLTTEFDRLLPLIVLSLVASVVVNVFYLWDDAPHIKSTGQIVTGVIGLFVAARTWTIFPFDFSNDEFNWETTARVILVVSIIGLALGILVEAARLVRSVGRTR